MGIIFKRPQNRQPQGGVRLDTSNALAQQAAFVLMPSLGKELVSSLGYTLAGSTPPTKSATPAGIATKHTSGIASVSYLDLGVPAGPSVDIASGPSTYIGVFYANTTSGVGIAERNDNNNTTGWLLGYANGAVGQLGLAFVRTYSSNNVRKAINESVVPGLNTLVATYDGGQLATGINVYLNGVLGTVKGTEDGVGTTGSDAALSLYVGRNAFDQGHSHDGSILLAGAFKRIWSAAEVAAFHRNPWQLFQSPPREFSLSVASAGTQVNPGVASITLTGPVPTVAQTANQTVLPGVASIALTGYAPTIAQPQSVNPGAASVALTGFAPTVAQTLNQFVAPGAASIAFTGYAPGLAQTANQALVPGVASVALTGYVPTVTQASASVSLTPDAGVLTLTGYAPVVAQSMPANPDGGGGGGKKKRKKGERGPIYYRHVEPEDFERFEQVAREIASEPQQPKAQAQARAVSVLKQYGIYREAYAKALLELEQIIRQEREDEEIAAVIAACL